MIEIIGAGEGNRTLVFSLEVSKYCSVFKRRSDSSQIFGRLRSLRSFSLSEWRLPAHTGPFQASCRRLQAQPPRRIPARVAVVLTGRVADKSIVRWTASIFLPARSRRIRKFVDARRSTIELSEHWRFAFLLQYSSGRNAGRHARHLGLAQGMTIRTAFRKLSRDESGAAVDRDRRRFAGLGPGPRCLNSCPIILWRRRRSISATSITLSVPSVSIMWPPDAESAACRNRQASARSTTQIQEMPPPRQTPRRAGAERCAKARGRRRYARRRRR